VTSTHESTGANLARIITHLVRIASGYCAGQNAGYEVSIPEFKRAFVRSAQPHGNRPPLMLNADLRRYLENELHERVQTAELAYRNASSLAAKQTQLLLGQAEDHDALLAAIAAERKAQETYHKAVETFSEFLLRHKIPSAQDLLEPVLSRAIEAAGADMGNIQVLDRRESALRITAQCGFARPFLDFFASVHDRARRILRSRSAGSPAHHCR